MANLKFWRSGTVLWAAGILTLAFFSCATTDTTGNGLSLLDALDQGAVEIVQNLPPKARIAVVEFKSSSSKLSDYIMEELSAALFDNGVDVCERKNLPYIQKELNLQYSGDFNDETMQSIGHFWGAQSLVTGELVDTGGQYRLRVTAMNVENARRESNARLDVTADRSLRNLISALDGNRTIKPSAKATKRENAQPVTAGEYFDRAMTRAFTTHYDNALADFAEAIRLDPSYASAYLMRGKTLLQSIGPGFGVIVTTVNDFFPDPERVLTGDEKAVYRRALPDLSKAIELLPVSRAYFYRAVAYQYLDELENAIADYTSAIDIKPDYAEALAMRGYLYRRTHDQTKCIEDLSKALSINPTVLFSDFFYNVMGVAYNASGDSLKAIESFDQALKNNIPDRQFLSNRGWAYSNLGNYDKALADFNAAISSNISRWSVGSNFSAHYTGRALVYYRKGDYDKAIIDAAQAIQLNPNDGEAYYVRADSYFAQKNYAKAIADYTEAISRGESPDAVLYNNRGRSYYSMGNYDHAVEDFTQAVNLNPSNATYYSNRADGYFNQKNYAKTIADYTEAISRGVSLDAVRYNWRGQSYYYTGNYDRAAEDFTQAVNLDPNNTSYKNNLEIAKRQGR